MTELTERLVEVPESRLLRLATAGEHGKCVVCGWCPHCRPHDGHTLDCWLATELILPQGCAKPLPPRIGTAVIVPVSAHGCGCFLRPVPLEESTCYEMALPWTTMPPAQEFEHAGQRLFEVNFPGYSSRGVPQPPWQGLRPVGRTTGWDGMQHRCDVAVWAFRVNESVQAELTQWLLTNPRDALRLKLHPSARIACEQLVACRFADSGRLP